MNDSLTKHVVVLAVLCIAVTGVTFLAVGVEAALCCAILSLVVFVFFLVVSLRRRAEIRRLTDEIDEVLNLGRRLSFSNCREGDVAVLANELEKMVARLSRLTSQIENEKTALADSLADISHQIRTPLTAAELMLPAIERATDEEQRKRLARDLEHLLDRVSWLVATLLKMAKVDAGALHMESRPVSVASMVARACAPLELSLDLRGIALVIEISDDVRFTGDETWCAEAVENIVKNSMEHCQAGGTITIRAEEDALACHISISDDGPAYPRRTFPTSSNASTGVPDRRRARALAWDSRSPARSSRDKAARCAPRTSRARMAAPPVPSSKSPFPKSASDVHRMPSLQSRNVRVMAELGSAFILDAVRKSEMRQLLRDAVSFHKGRNHHGHPQGQQPDEGLR